MKLVVNKNNNIIVAKGSLCEIKPELNAIELEENYYISPIDEFTVHEVANELSYEIGKHCYDGIKLYNNTNYIAPPKSEQERISELEAENAKLKETIALQDSAIMDLASMISQMSNGGTA